MSITKILLNKGRHAMAFLYVLVSVLPHFAAITHTHAVGEMPHAHNILSVHDESLKRGILENLGDVSALKSLPTSVEAQEEAAIGFPALERGTRALHAPVLKHSHFQEDPNLSAVGVCFAQPAALLELKSLISFRRPFVPALSALEPSARGPPILSLSV